jgi:hypothetical protein
MMRRREFIRALGGGAAWPLTARAQQANLVKRIGWLTSARLGDQQLQSLYEMLPQELQRLGWESGRNLQINQSWASGDDALLRVLAADLVRERPDAIICTGTQTTGTGGDGVFRQDALRRCIARATGVSPGSISIRETLTEHWGGEPPRR